jgi:hypothetical protein
MRRACSDRKARDSHKIRGAAAGPGRRGRAGQRPTPVEGEGCGRAGQRSVRVTARGLPLPPAAMAAAICARASRMGLY